MAQTTTPHRSSSRSNLAWAGDRDRERERLLLPRSPWKRVPASGYGEFQPDCRLNVDQVPFNLDNQARKTFVHKDDDQVVQVSGQPGGGVLPQPPRMQRPEVMYKRKQLCWTPVEADVLLRQGDLDAHRVLLRQLLAALTYWRRGGGGMQSSASLHCCRATAGKNGAPGQGLRS